MLTSMLKINDSKTELIVFINQRTNTPAECQSILSSITLGGCTITATTTVRNLGVVLDSCLNRTAQVSAIVRSCNYHLYQIGQVRHYISDESCKLAVLALVVSRLDYCNGLLAAITQQQVKKLQNIQNRAAKLVARPRAPRGEIVHVTPILQQLNWLPIQQRITYKLCICVYNCLNNQGPLYLQELLNLHVRDQRLRQAAPLELVHRHPKRKVGSAGFGVAGPAAWNILPPTLRVVDSKDSFKKLLKTFLWHQSYE